MTRRGGLLVMTTMIAVPVTFWETWFALANTPPELQIKAYAWTFIAMLTVAANVRVIWERRNKSKLAAMTFTVKPHHRA